MDSIVRKSPARLVTLIPSHLNQPRLIRDEKPLKGISFRLFPAGGCRSKLVRLALVRGER